jgi:hypothetical protein
LSATSQDGRKIRENKKGKRDCVEAISFIIANVEMAKNIHLHKSGNLLAIRASSQQL